MESCAFNSTVTLPEGPLPDGSLDVRQYYPGETPAVTPPAGPPPAPATTPWFKSPCSEAKYRILDDGFIELAGAGVINRDASWPSAVEQWRAIIDTAASEFTVPAALIAAVMAAESGGEATARSSAGAMGLMQIMPDTMDSLAGRDVAPAEGYDPLLNVRMGAKLLSQLLESHKYNYAKVLASYNLGHVECRGPDCKAKPCDNDRWGLCAACGYIDKILGYHNTAAAKGFSSARVIDLGDDIPGVEPADVKIGGGKDLAGSVGLGLLLGTLGGVAWWLWRSK